MSTDTSRLSFAKVAASARKDNLSFSRIAGSTSRDSRRENPSPQIIYTGVEISDQPNGTLDTKNILEEKMSSDVECMNDESQKFKTPQNNENEENLLEAVKALNVSSPMPRLAINGSGISKVKSKTVTANGFSEDLFQRVDSGSELGTKPPSLDEKSTTSGTTFAMDEKESLRPDDSASAKALEDDDTFSGRGSIVAGSRIGSEAAARAHRAQLYEASDRRNVPQIPENRLQAVTATQSGSSGSRPGEDRKSKVNSTPEMPEGFNLFYRQTPDEKLLEALESVKDRIFLLRLEQEVIEFVRSSKEPYIDLPPCNSFCRMLTHKLADYYHLTHQVDAIAGAVRIFRTPFCRLPPSLTSLSNPPTSGTTPPPATMTIMRRGDDTGPSPSKALSESGSDGKDKGLSAKEKLSREEREAAYNKARERIFGKEEKNGDATPDTEESREISRSSSLSTKERISQSKKSRPAKQRRDDSESFDSRSQYTPFFPQPQGPTWIPSAQYSPMGPQSFNGTSRPFQSPLSPQYSTSTQQFNPAMINPGSIQSFNMTQQFSTQNTQRFPPNNTPINTYGSPVQSPPIIPQQWSQPPYPSPYQQSVTSVRGPSNSIPYAFGQLPSTANPADPKSQHPIPGSFNRHAFNPKTQSFVPGGVGIPMTQQITHHGAPHFESSHNSSHNSSPHPSYNSFNSPQQFGNAVGYNMARQSSNNSLPPYHTPPLMSHRPLMHQTIPPNSSQGMSHLVVPGMPQNHINIGHTSQIGNHLPNYGNPSTLPPKPPAGI